MLVQVAGPGGAGGAFVAVLPRSAEFAAPLHPRTITAPETADKLDLIISFMPRTPHPSIGISGLATVMAYCKIAGCVIGCG
jgi:hypothetical protein